MTARLARPHSRTYRRAALEVAGQSKWSSRGGREHEPSWSSGWWLQFGILEPCSASRVLLSRPSYSGHSCARPYDQTQVCQFHSQGSSRTSLLQFAASDDGARAECRLVAKAVRDAALEMTH